MHLIRILGLAAAMALLTTAMLGATSAMAESTTLCKEDTQNNLCPEAKRAAHVHFETQKLQGGVLVPAKAKLLTGNFGVTVECVILFLGDVQDAGFLASPLTIHGAFSFSSCTAGCSVYETEGSPGIIKVLKEGGVGSELGKVTGEVTFAVNCGVIWECEYDFVNLVGHFLGTLTPTHNGHLTYSEAVLHKTGLGLVCPEETKLDALLLSLEALYIRS